VKTELDCGEPELMDLASEIESARNRETGILTTDSGGEPPNCGLASFNRPHRGLLPQEGASRRNAKGAK